MASACIHCVKNGIVFITISDPICWKFFSSNVNTTTINVHDECHILYSEIAFEIPLMYAN